MMQLQQLGQLFLTKVVILNLQIQQLISLELLQKVVLQKENSQKLFYLKNMLLKIDSM